VLAPAVVGRATAAAAATVLLGGVVWIVAAKGVGALVLAPLLQRAQLLHLDGIGDDVLHGCLFLAPNGEKRVLAHLGLGIPVLCSRVRRRKRVWHRRILPSVCPSDTSVPTVCLRSMAATAPHSLHTRGWAGGCNMCVCVCLCECECIHVYTGARVAWLR
jgi:hypothetical protein